MQTHHPEKVTVSKINRAGASPASSTKYAVVVYWTRPSATNGASERRK